MNFPVIPKKIVHTSYSFLRISDLFQVPFLLRIFFGKSQTTYFFCTFHKKNILKEPKTFTKLRKQNVVYAHEIS